MLIFGCLTVVWWFYTFRGFLFGRFALQGDATSYYDHIKFFVESMMRGVYPLWDPYWNHGVPNEFFLRRMGSYNPFYALIAVFRFIGLSYIKSYMLFLSTYYFLGMGGFYLLAKELFKDRELAFIAYLLLTASSLTTSLFSSFIILIFTPMVWFFYAVVAFSREQEKRFVAVATFALMILLITYIPFYFLTIFFVFLLVYSLLFFNEFKAYIGKLIHFGKNNTLFLAVCAAGLILSVVPGYMFHASASEGEFVLPIRNVHAPSGNVLMVDSQSILKGGITTDAVFDHLFSNLKQLGLGVLYIPVFSYLLFMLGAVCRINRRMILFALCFFWIYTIGLYDISPVYGFLYKHVFFFKYFRNFQFFPWLGMLPFYILLCVEHLKSYLNRTEISKTQYYFEQVVLMVAHLVFIFFLFSKGRIVASSYVVVILSLAFFLRTHFLVFKNPAGKGRNKDIWKTCGLFVLSGITVLTFIQPIEVYHYLNNRAESYTPNIYDKISYDFRYIEGRPEEKIEQESRQVSVYYGTKWYNIFSQKLKHHAFLNYMNYKFIFYDYVEDLSGRTWQIAEIERAILNKENKAFVFRDKNIPIPQGEISGRPPLFISGPGEEFEVLAYSPNTVRLKSKFNTSRFLVYNDAFHSQWRVFVNNKATILWRANLAFKGVWIPAGENIIEFKFGSLKLRIFNLVFFILFYGFVAYTVYLFNGKIRCS